jgi:hypothetical protein
VTVPSNASVGICPQGYAIRAVTVPDAFWADVGTPEQYDEVSPSGGGGGMVSAAKD